MTQISLSSKIYADSLVQLGQDNIISYTDILKNLEIIQEICQSSNDLVQVLENPSISLETKNSIIDEVFSKNIDEKIKDFLKIIVEKKRFTEFNSIVEAYKNQLDEINNIKRIKVVSAINLSEEKKQLIVEKLENKLHKKIIADWTVNNEIIGGLVIKIDDDVIDTSLKNKLENLSKNII